MGSAFNTRRHADKVYSESHIVKCNLEGINKDGRIILKCIEEY
jgi:hypothetical protein